MGVIQGDVWCWCECIECIDMLYYALSGLIMVDGFSRWAMPIAGVLRPVGALHCVQLWQHHETQALKGCDIR